MALHDYNANSAIAEPILCRKSPTFQNAFITLYTAVKQKGCKPTSMHMFNEVLEDYLNLIE